MVSRDLIETGAGITPTPTLALRRKIPPQLEGSWDLGEDRRGSSTERREIAAIVAAVWNHRYSLIFTGLLIAILTWIGSGFIPAIYSASAFIRVDGNGVDALNERQAEPMSFIDPTAIMTRIEALKSASVISLAAENAGARYLESLNPEIDRRRLDRKKPREPMFDVSGYGPVALNFGESVSIRQVGTSGVAEISVSSQDPLFAARAANAIGDAFINEVLREKRIKQLDAIDILSRQINETNAQLNVLENRILQVRNENQVLLYGDTLTGVRLQEVSRTQGLITAGKAELAETRRRLEIVDAARAAGTDGDALNLISFSTLINDLRGQRAELEVEFVQVQSNYGSQHPKYIQAKEALDTVDQSIASELNRIHQSIRNEIQEITRRIATLEQRLTESEVQIDTEAVGLVRLASLDGEAQSLRNALASFSQQIDTVENTLLLQSPEASFISTAAVPELPYFPRRKVMVVASAFCWGALYVFAIAAFAVMSPRLRTPEDVKEFERVIGSDVIGVMPRCNRRATSNYLKLFDADFARGIDGIAARLGVRVGGTKSIVVSPAEAGAGGSSTAAALAISIATVGIKTLLVELDSRQKLSAFFRTSGALGLTNYVRGGCNPHSLLESTSVLDLEFLPHGQFDDGFDGRALDCLYNIVEDLRMEYDCIIVNTRPLDDAPRISELCKLADHTVVVAKPLRSQAASISRNLRQVDPNLYNRISIVINQVEPEQILVD